MHVELEGFAETHTKESGAELNFSNYFIVTCGHFISVQHLPRISKIRKEIIDHIIDHI